MKRSVEKPVKRRRRYLPAVLLAPVLLIAVMLIDSNMRIVTTEYELHYENLPNPFDGFRIVVLADIHDAEFGRGNERLISRTRDAKPDIIAIVGDLLNAYENRCPVEEQFARVRELIIGLRTIAPIYFVTGNHDQLQRDGGPGTLLELLNDYGVHVLRNEYTYIESDGSFIVLGGIDGKVGSVAQRDAKLFIEEVIASEGDSFIMLLDHINQNLTLYSEFGIDLVLSGHAHGGMIRLPFTDGLVGPERDFLPTFTNGLYSAGNTNMLVSRGLGNPTAWPRFLNNPHIAVAILKSH